MKMKKYLMTGIATLALCVGFTSCSHDLESLSQEEIDQLKAKQITEKYNQAFIATFGQPAANQNWGFGPSAGARTRTGSKNINLWGDPNADGGSWNWQVPPALTELQKKRVIAYFQANPGLTYEDPKLKNFFVQQVYKGGNHPGAISSEQYTQTNGTPLIGSNNMDWLYAGKENDHINDFNNGEWNNGTPYEVLNTGANTNDHAGNTTHVEGVTHPDQITLMLNSSTEYIAFGSSTGSVYHTNCCALAGYDVIDAWAETKKDSLQAVGMYGESLDDGWERSFVGLDYENRTVDGLYSGGNAKALDFIDGNSHWILYNGTVYSSNNFTPGNFDLKNTMGENVRYVTDNVSNQAIADYIKYTKSDGTVANVTKDAYNYKLTKDQFKSLYNVDITNGEDGIYNLDMILGYILQSALPTQNNGNWVKNIGGRDYVFSDWIVTLTEAKKQTPGPDPTPDPFTAQLRIMAEDLSATEKSDFDFNDIVFDVQFNRAATETTAAKPARILVRAAGGTLPLRIKIGVEADHNDPTETGNGWQEIHALWNKSTGIMINTNADERVSPSKGWDTNEDLAPIELTYDVWNETDAKDIIIEVLKNGDWIPMEAEVGMPAAKFACSPEDHPWAEERQSLSGSYTNFAEWVQGKAPYWNWNSFDF